MKKVPGISGMYLICTCFHSGTLPTGTGTGTRYFLFTRCRYRPVQVQIQQNQYTGTGTGTSTWPQPCWWSVKISSGNGLVPSGKATSHYLSQCWSRYLSPYGVSLGQNELMSLSPSPSLWIKCGLTCVFLLRVHHITEPYGQSKDPGHWLSCRLNLQEQHERLR